MARRTMFGSNSDVSAVVAAGFKPANRRGNVIGWLKLGRHSIRNGSCVSVGAAEFIPTQSGCRPTLCLLALSVFLAPPALAQHQRTELLAGGASKVSLIAHPQVASTALEWEKIVDPVAKSVSKAMRNVPEWLRPSNGRKQVLILDFTSKQGTESELGQFLASDFADALSKVARGFTVYDRARLNRTLVELEVDQLPEIDQSAWLAVARALGAEIIITGNYAVVGTFVNVEAKLLRSDDGQETDRLKGSIHLTDAMQQSLTRKRNEFVFPPKPDRSAQAIKEFCEGATSDSRTPPRCKSCPDPRFAETARLAKYSGTVTLRVLIDETGNPSKVQVFGGAPFGLNAQAVEAVRKWKFEPARDEDNKLIRACVVVEVAFHLLR